METKGLWEWIGFRDVALRGVKEGWLETNGLWDGDGFQDVPLRGVREGYWKPMASGTGLVSRRCH